MRLLILCAVLVAIVRAGAKHDCFVDNRVRPGMPGYGTLVFPDFLDPIMRERCENIFARFHRDIVSHPGDNCDGPALVANADTCTRYPYRISRELPDCTVDGGATPDSCEYGTTLFPSMACAMKQSGCINIYLRVHWT
jgi:hypothetical protein